MDTSTFDQITRRLALATTRRRSIASLVAGALGLAGISAADAARGAGRRHERLACRNDQSECTANEQCCSGICKLKPGSGTEYRCVGDEKKNEKKDDEKKHRDRNDAICIELYQPCDESRQCCGFGNGSFVLCTDYGTGNLCFPS